MVLFIDCEIVHACVFLGLTEDLEVRALNGKPLETLRERRRVPRKTGDGACRNGGAGTEGVERNGSDGNPEELSLFRGRRSSRNVPKV